MVIKGFNRREMKYVIRANLIDDITNDLMSYMYLDAHSKSGRGYRITSLYYDTTDSQSLRQKIDGTNYRRKLRIRIYGDRVEPTGTAYVEIKERRDMITRKRRTGLPYEVVHEFCCTGRLSDEYWNQEDEALFNELTHICSSLQIQPACVVRYDRLALNGHDDYNGDLRVTFDTNMRGRTYDLTLTSRSEEMPYFISPTWAVLEVKVDATVPRWLLGILAKHHLVSQRVSKFACTLIVGDTISKSQRIVYPEVLTRYG